jgi:lysozyme
MALPMKKLFVSTFLLSCFFGVLVVLDFFGIIWHNAPFARQFEVKGLDVSHHQNDIDWKKVANTKKYTFVFIKATEGHDFIDDEFADNWKEAKEQGFLVGAYHFFSTRSSGAEQAQYFISTVPREDNSLPPVIDVEISTAKDKEKVHQELSALAQKLEEHYRKKPIFYVTYATYESFIKGKFDTYSIWIRDIWKKPASDHWALWQYSNRGRVPGITTYVDQNVFRGSREELEKLSE